MKSRNIRNISILLAITLTAQMAFGLKIFDITAKAAQSVSQEETAGKINSETEAEETMTTEPSEEEQTTSEPVPEETTTPEPVTEEPTTVDYEIIDGIYKVKKGTLIEYLGNKKDKTVTSLIIPAKITTIDDSVFEDCQYIKKVTFASGSKLTKIGMYAFKSCKALETISLPSTLKTIEYRAFGACTSLEKFKIPDSVTAGRQIFGTSGTVKTVTFGDKMKAIPNYILKNAGSVTTVNLPSKVKTIGKWSFYNCTSLKKISFPSTVTVLNASAFYNCKSMTKVTMSKNITTIGNYVFKKCTGLTSLTLYKNIKSIGTGAFSGDSALTLKVYANSKGKAYARANKINWDYTASEKKRRAENQVIYNDYMSKISSGDKKKFRLKYLSNYVPQGSCVIGKYLIVSMYHKYLSKRSILAVYRKTTGVFVKKIVLPYYDHVGGLANVKGRLVVSLNNISVNDYLAVYKYSKIKKAKNGKVQKPAYKLWLPGSADFSAFDGTYFWAGRSANISYATMQGYKVKVKKKKLVFIRKKSYYIPANVQGLVIQKLGKIKRRFVFSQSYGRIKNSALIAYTKNINKSGGLGAAKKTLTLPSMLEGIALGKKKYLYMVFESGAGLYCSNPDNTSEIQIKNVCRIKSNKFGF